jgi:hypothetical protein
VCSDVPEVEVQLLVRCADLTQLLDDLACGDTRASTQSTLAKVERVQFPIQNAEVVIAGTAWIVTAESDLS